MRQFKHLSSETRRSIYVGYVSNEPKLAIARRLSIDNATVHYHINKIKHLSEREIIQLITPPCPHCDAGHTSFKCLVCGRAHDNIKCEEFQTIKRLRIEVADLKSRLERYERSDINSNRISPITVVVD
jgi:hypothetical protein